MANPRCISDTSVDRETAPRGGGHGVPPFTSTDSFHLISIRIDFFADGLDKRSVVNEYGAYGLFMFAGHALLSKPILERYERSRPLP